MQALTKLVGIRNFQPLKEKFIGIYVGGYTEIPTLPHIPAGLEVTLARNGGIRPLVSLSLPLLANSLKHGYKLTTSADFSSALHVFRDIIQSAPLLSVSSEKEEAEVRELLKICTEYVTCMRLELQRQGEQKAGRVGRMLELSYYMTLCGLQPPHLSLTLRSAISAMYKGKCFVTCVSLCKRFLDLTQKFPQVLGKDGATIVDKHKKLLAYCQQVFTNEVKFSEDLPETAQDISSVLCAQTFTQVGPTVPTSRCPLCGSQFHRVHKGSVCATCEVAEVGAETLGLKVFLEDR
jgi:coatomer protein complex subunit alpha (xenin)